MTRGDYDEMCGCQQFKKDEQIMLKKLAILLMTLPALAFGDVKNLDVTVTGSVVKTCEISVSSINFNLGEYKAREWRTENRYMNRDHRVPIQISDCDAGTTVTITASGTSGEEAFWMSNTGGSNPDIQAEVTIVKLGETTYWTLFMDGSRPRLYTTMEANSSQDLILRGVLTRKTLDTAPVGTFQGNMTIIFTFA